MQEQANHFTDDINIGLSIRDAVEKLPPSPPNTFPDFIDRVSSGQQIPAGCSPENRILIDVASFWENRRVQNLLRRVLEKFQEHQSTQDADDHELDTGRAFDEIMDVAQRELGWRNTDGFDDRIFIEAMQKLGVWPPEMSDLDKQEVFLALTVNSATVVRSLVQGQPRPHLLVRRMFLEGLLYVPFNLPDFPVPTDQLTNTATNDSTVPEVARQIAAIFNTEGDGHRRVKDFYLCGLLSLEEIQVALPRLVPHGLVAEACLRIIRRSKQFFPDAQWSKYVEQVRSNPDYYANEIQEPPQQELREQRPQEPNLEAPERPLLTHAQAVPNVEPPHAWTQPFRQPDLESPVAGGVADAGEREPGLVGRPSPPATMPLPSRAAKEETAVSYATAVSSDMPPSNAERRSREAERGQLIDWAGSRTVQADISELGQEGDAAAGVSRQDEDSRLEPARFANDDPVLWVSMEMMSECHGPYLAKAFGKCCDHYEAQSGRRTLFS
jgi:hypothetical protein